MQFKMSVTISGLFMKENQRKSLFVWLVEVFMKSSLIDKASKKKIWEFWND